MTRTLAMAAVVVAAIVGAYFAGRAGRPAVRASPSIQTTMPTSAAQAAEAASSDRLPTATPGGLMPVAGAPLKDSFARLQARANAGDADAASRLVRDLDRCNRLRGSQWKHADATDALTRRSTEGMSAAQLRTYQALLDSMALRQQAVSKDQALCDGVSQQMLDTLVPNIAQAAKLGDKQARACYLDRGPLYDAHSLLRHPESLRAYRSAASAMIQSGLDAGDWRVVDLLRQAYEPGSNSLLAGVLGNDPVQHYRYLKLYRLGAESHRADGLDRQLAPIASTLSPAQIAEADAWAQTELRTRFRDASTQTTPTGWDACAF